MKLRSTGLVLFAVGVCAVYTAFITNASQRNAAQSLAAPPELILQTGHSKLVESVVVSPDNKWAATGSFDSSIKIWDLENGRELRSLAGHVGAVKALALSPDGKWLASGGNDQTLRIWNVERGVEAGSFANKENIIEAIAFSRDGTKDGRRDRHPRHGLGP
jgi:WD40 repeat protein